MLPSPRWPNRCVRRRAAAGDHGGHVLGERRQRRRRQRDVELVGHAERVDRLGMPLAVAPQLGPPRPRRSAGRRRVRRPGRRRSASGSVAGAGPLHQQGDAAVRPETAAAGPKASRHEGEAVAEHHLGGVEPGTRAPQLGGHRHRLRRPSGRRPARRRGRRVGHESQSGRGDDAERALAADSRPAGRSRCCPSPTRRGGGPPCRRRAPPPRRAAAPRMAPWRSTRMPPALVATMPPTVARVARPRGRRRTPSRLPLRRWLQRGVRVAPAPAVTWPARASTGSRRSSRRRVSTIAPAASPHRHAAGTSPVLPPCGTRATPCSAHQATTAATSAVSAGRTTARRRAAEPPGPVDLVAGAHVGVGQDVRRRRRWRRAPAQQWAARARSSMARPRSSSSSVIVSGGMRRSTLSSRPAGQHEQRRRRSTACCTAAAIGPEASSTPIMSPMPRTSQHAGAVARARRAARTATARPRGGTARRGPRRRARRAWPGRPRSSTGLPPNVEPWVPSGQRSITGAGDDARRAAAPTRRPWRTARRRARTPNVSAANGRPVRPMPHCTSSNTSRMPWRSHARAGPRATPTGGTT